MALVTVVSPYVQGVFRGTGISLFQNRETETGGIMRQIPDIQPDLLRKQIPTLPESMLTRLTAKQDVVIPTTQSTLTCDHELVNTAIDEEAKWQSNTRRLISEGIHSVDDPISWAAFHSNQEPPHDFDVTIGSFLPLFPDDSKSVAMISHVMYVVQQAVRHLNPGQVPVLTLDQPLHAIAKQIQWNWPSGYGEDKFVILLSGLHLEMASLATIGDLLGGSGWTHALAQANIATPGTAESFFKTTHVTRTRHAHQVTASALSILLHMAYDTYRCEESEPKLFDEWCVNRVEVFPPFQFWLIIM